MVKIAIITLFLLINSQEKFQEMVKLHFATKKKKECMLNGP
jgi:hypothetical protein